MKLFEKQSERSNMVSRGSVNSDANLKHVYTREERM